MFQRFVLAITETPMLKRTILTLVLAATMGGCLHRTSVRPPVEPVFPVVTTPLPQGADAWVCEFKNGGGFQVCDAVIIDGGQHVVAGGHFVHTAFPTPRQFESLDGYVRVDQLNGLIVYWRARMMQ